MVTTPISTDENPRLRKEGVDVERNRENLQLVEHRDNSLQKSAQISRAKCIAFSAGFINQELSLVATRCLWLMLMVMNGWLEEPRSHEV